VKICLFADAQSVHIHQLVLGIASRGHAVHVVTHKPVPVPGATVERFHVPGPSVTNPRRWEGRRSNYLRGFLRRFEVVNIHFLQDWGFRFHPPLIEKACLIASAWGSDIVDPPGEIPAEAELTQRRRTLLRRADAVTACGPTFAGMVADYGGIAANHIDILPFGVDLDIFRSAATTRTTALRKRLEPHRIGFFKGFREVYGPTFLIQAIPLVRDRFPEVRFELVGDGPQFAKCREMAATLGIQSAIEWIPRQPHNELPKLISRWDVSVIPSVQEAFGVAALESSAMGVPVVASNVGGLCDTVRHGETGLLVPPRDPQAIADGIIKLLENVELRQKMGRAGREMVEADYNWSDLHDRWISFYEQVRDHLTVGGTPDCLVESAVS